MAQHPSEEVARFIEDAWERRDTDALRWCIQRAGFALMRCYPEDRARDILWGAFRSITGPEVAREEG